MPELLMGSKRSAKMIQWINAELPRLDPADCL